MQRSLKQDGTRRWTLAGAGGQKGGMFGESTGPFDNIPSDAPVGGNRKSTEQVVPAQRAGCSTSMLSFLVTSETPFWMFRSNT
jgi:hypothetical protein